MLTVLMRGDRAALGHAQRVSGMAVALGARLDLSSREQSVIRQAGLLHDVGKLAMPEAILRKPAPLMPGELSLIRLHPGIGADLIEEVPFLHAAAAIMRDALERMDGRGYPRRRPAADLPLAARILGVADAFDAMTHARVFRDPISHADALLEIDRCGETQFDRRVVDAVLALVTGRSG